jgi:hypothetical protein
MMKTTSNIAVCVIGLLLVGSGAGAQQPATDASDQSVVAELTRMGTYLRGLTDFQVNGETLRDAVLDSGHKIQIGGRFQLVVHRPDRLRADVVTDRMNRQFYYNGKSFTIFAPRLGYYATVPAPASLRELVETVDTKYGIELPLVDVFHWASDKPAFERISAAMRIGESTIGGISCEQFALRQAAVDWQIWIRKGNQPLPCKLVITSTHDQAQSQYASVLKWSVGKPANDRIFSFSPRSNTAAIAIEQVDRSSAGK